VSQYDQPNFVESLATGVADAGAGQTLEDALHDAYNKGNAHTGRNCFRVVEIQVCGTNPVTDYKVIVAPL
jgi:hypothetical protein